VLNHDAVGKARVSAEYSWTDRDVLLYALAVGASQDDPFSELQFTTENTAGVTLEVLPTYASLVAQQAADRPVLGDFGPGMAVHAGEHFVQHRPLPVAATVVATTRITGMYDKGAGALITIDNVVEHARTHEKYITTTSNIFVNGEGGFGGERGPSAKLSFPDRPADHVIVYPTRPEQALLYRLLGDRNPLHSDPQLARKRGSERPTLHGLCTWGFVGRAVLHSVCNGEATRLKSMSGRFTQPVTPGDELSVELWTCGDGEVTYRASTKPDVMVLAGSASVAG
jgi:acyl dehydratase